MDKDASDAIQQANAIVSEVDALKDAGMSEETAVNRLYYACFHATKAVLFERGHDPKTHKGIKVLIGKELQQKGDITTNDVRFFNQISDHRDRADYEYLAIPADVDTLFERTEGFVETMEELLAEDKNDS